MRCKAKKTKESYWLETEKKYIAIMAQKMVQQTNVGNKNRCDHNVLEVYIKIIKVALITKESQ